MHHCLSIDNFLGSLQERQHKEIYFCQLKAVCFGCSETTVNALLQLAATVFTRKLLEILRDSARQQSSACKHAETLRGTQEIPSERLGVIYAGFARLQSFLF
jgi:hypothetical protein